MASLVQMKPLPEPMLTYHILKCDRLLSPCTVMKNSIVVYWTKKLQSIWDENLNIFISIRQVILQKTFANILSFSQCAEMFVFFQIITVDNFSGGLSFFMPPPLGTGGIMFSGCPSVLPSVRSLKYPLLTCTWVRLSTPPTVTVLRHVRPCVHPSVQRSFRAFAGERMEEMAWNFACWCILTTSRTDLNYGHALLIFLILALFWLSETGQVWGFWAFPGERIEEMAWNFAPWCILTTFRTDKFMATFYWFFKFWHYFDLVKLVKFGVSGHFPENAWRKWPEILHADVSWQPSELISLWPRSVDFSNFGTILTYRLVSNIRHI